MSQLKVRLGPDGVHFFNRNSGMNILVEEVKTPSHLWSSAPRQISIALTNVCDLSCFHCYAPKHNAALSFEYVKNWLIDLDANGCIGVGFGGGEPTLYSKFLELCSFASKQTKLAVTMTTHAHHLSDQFLDELAGNIHFVRISMDGIGKTYESIRGRSFDELIKRVSALSRISPFGINFLVNSKTLPDLDAAIALAEELGAREFLLLPEMPVIGSSGIDRETYKILKSWVIKYCGRIPLSINETHAEGLPICNPFASETGLAAYAHIDASGVLKKTSYDIKGIQILGNDILGAINELKNQER